MKKPPLRVGAPQAAVLSFVAVFCGAMIVAGFITDNYRGHFALMLVFALAATASAFFYVRSRE